jgi:hypothetical protein
MGLSAKLRKSLSSGDWKNLFIELIIVIVGVLIAVGIDDYASDLKRRVTTKNYLENLVFDLQEDTTELHRSIQFAKQKIRSLSMVLDTIASRKIAKAPIEAFLDPHLQYIGIENHISFQTQTLEALRETGNFEQLRNDSLVQLLFDYQKYCNTLLSSEAADNRFIRDIIEVYTYEYIPLRRLLPFRNFYPENNPPVSNETWYNILTEKRFENLVLASILRAQISIGSYQTAYEKAKGIMLEVEKILNQ